MLIKSGTQKRQKRYPAGQQRDGQNNFRKFNCGNCGQQHAAKSCPAYGKTCNNCHKLVHFAKLCRSGRYRQTVREVEYEAEDDPREHGIDTTEATVIDTACMKPTLSQTM